MDAPRECGLGTPKRQCSFAAPLAWHRPGPHHQRNARRPAHRGVPLPYSIPNVCGTEAPDSRELGKHAWVRTRFDVILAHDEVW